MTYNYPTWFLSVLLFFYLIFPYILAYFTNKKGTQIFLLVSAVWIFSTILLFTYYNKPAFIINHNEFYDFILFNPIIMYLNAFIIGIAGGIFVVRNKDLKYPDLIPAIMIVLFLILIWFILSLDTRITGGRLFYPNGLLSPLFLMLIIGPVVSDSF
jgi:peptidoglycan/LPS O-acetylase OafA/YrhL